MLLINRNINQRLIVTVQYISTDRFTLEGWLTQKILSCNLAALKDTHIIEREIVNCKQFIYIPIKVLHCLITIHILFIDCIKCIRPNMLIINLNFISTTSQNINILRLSFDKFWMKFSKITNHSLMQFLQLKIKNNLYVNNVLLSYDQIESEQSW